MKQWTVPAAFALALQHHRAGRLAEAESIYRQILAQQPENTDALHLLGVLASQMGQYDAAVDLMRRALSLKPDFPDAYNNLGHALHAKGQRDEAMAAYRQAILLRSNFPEAYSNLSNALREKGQQDEAMAASRQAIALKPNYAEAHGNLGLALSEKGQLEEAIAAYRQAITLNPNYSEAHYNLGNALSEQGHTEEAIASYRRAIDLKSNFAEAYGNLGLALSSQGQMAEAIAACRQAVILRPGYAEGHNNLGIALSEVWRLDEAVASYHQAIALNPNFADAHRNLGSALRHQGQLDEAITAYRQAMALQPGDPTAHSSLISTLHLHPNYDAQAIHREHVAWFHQHAEPLRRLIQPSARDRTPNRRLRIGYVSPDMRGHPVGRFLLPLLAAHRHDEFEIFGYSDARAPDEITERLSGKADQWRVIVGMTDEQVAALIREDRIDILVDLTMHAAGNRLLVFARRPAPVQVTYLAYCSTTGLDTIDYRFTDRHLDPPGSDTRCYSEASWRLPETYWCYGQSCATPANELPALQRGYITFGCLNNFCKISPQTLDTWARLLQVVPDSRLILYAHAGSHRQRILDFLVNRGVEAARCAFVEWAPWEAYFQLYHRMDVALDPFPFAGGTTTCDALWMGVPVVTLAGQTAVGRGGVSLLSNVGLRELVAKTCAEYVDIAAKLAGDVSRLSAMRSTLRERMERSPLMDAPKFARDVEAAYREMWRRWCAGTVA